MKSICLLLALMVFCSCGNKHCFKCKDGNTVCIDEQIQLYPTYSKQYSFALEAILKVINKLETKGDIELNQSIVLLREKLDQKSNRLEIKAKTALAAFQTAPCDSISRVKFWECMKEITNQKDQLDSLSNSVKIVGETGNNNKIKEIVDMSICVLDSNKMVLPCILK